HQELQGATRRAARAAGAAGGAAGATPGAAGAAGGAAGATVAAGGAAGATVTAGGAAGACGRSCRSRRRSCRSHSDCRRSCRSRRRSCRSCRSHTRSCRSHSDCRRSCRSHTRSCRRAAGGAAGATVTAGAAGGAAGAAGATVTAGRAAGAAGATVTAGGAAGGAAAAAGGALGAVPRCKPLRHACEKEIVLYAHYRGLRNFSTECRHAPHAYRGHARSLLKELEASRSCSVAALGHSGRRLRVAAGVATASLGSCSRCGFASSQALCKACVLLAALEKGLPRLGAGQALAEGGHGAWGGGGGGRGVAMAVVGLDRWGWWPWG
ncbi:LOW QUALITY PROTEIN: cytoplasmic tRNA 2-thiolation protein 1-like, partial [Colius striatus]|uniref:LOW QUALITY PROTEIN: cytoplasmic tRNA 2-thiolation protein 1-like n=1 Tax=Colius striatus TaxID=57412 RepID=UPI002B1E1F1F